MKTNTKQKVGLIAAGLILLAIISGDLYFNNRHDANSGNITSAPMGPQPTQNTSLANTNTDNGQTNAADNSNSTAITYARVSRHRRMHHHGRKMTDNATRLDEYNRSADYNAMAVNTTKKPESIIHQTSNDHYGYTPVNSETGTKIHRVHFGLEAGYNQNGLNHNQASNIQRNGFHAGAIMDIAMNSHFSFQPGLMYTEKGNQVQSELDVNDKEKLTLNYIEVPLDIVFKFGQVGDARFFIGAGPYFAYLANARDNFQTDNNDNAAVDVVGYTPATPYYNVSRIRTFDYGLGGFVGAEIPEGLYAKVGGELGLRNIQDNPVDGTYTDRNYSFLVSIGYILGYER